MPSTEFYAEDGLVDAVDQARVAAIRLKLSYRSLTTWTFCWGPDEGWCGCLHPNHVEAAKCLIRHRFIGGRRGVSDRRVRRVVNGDPVELVTATGETMQLAGTYRRAR